MRFRPNECWLCDYVPLMTRTSDVWLSGGLSVSNVELVPSSSRNRMGSVRLVLTVLQRQTGIHPAARSSVQIVKLVKARLFGNFGGVQATNPSGTHEEYAVAWQGLPRARLELAEGDEAGMRHMTAVPLGSVANIYDIDLTADYQLLGFLRAECLNHVSNIAEGVTTASEIIR